MTPVRWETFSDTPTVQTSMAWYRNLEPAMSYPKREPRFSNRYILVDSKEAVETKQHDSGDLFTKPLQPLPRLSTCTPFLMSKTRARKTRLRTRVLQPHATRTSLNPMPGATANEPLGDSMNGRRNCSWRTSPSLHRPPTSRTVTASAASQRDRVKRNPTGRSTSSVAGLITLHGFRPPLSGAGEELLVCRHVWGCEARSLCSTYVLQPATHVALRPAENRHDSTR